MSEEMPAAVTPASVRLMPARWVRLPGTPFEVYLHGKWLGKRCEGVIVAHTGTRPQYGGWDLAPVAHCTYLRNVNL